MSERLYRSRDDRIIAGVAGGLAERLDVDPALIRIVWAVLVLPTGFLALLVYIVAALVVPDEDEMDRQAGLDQAGLGTSPTPAGPHWPANPSGPPAPWTGSYPVASRPGPPPSDGPAAAAPGQVPPAQMPPVQMPQAQMRGSPVASPPVPPMPPMTRGSRRAQRRAARAARRGDRDRGPASVIVGGGLIVLGSWFLVRDYIPALDASRFWPVAAVGMGVLLVILALSRRSDTQDGDR
jgi:phage shock protein C